MKKYFYPNKIIHSLILFFLSLLLTSPFILLEKSLSPEVWQTLIFAVFILCFIGLTYLMNIKRKENIKLIFKLNHKTQLYLMILMVIIFQIGFAKPINHLLKLSFEQDVFLINPLDTFVISIGAIFLGAIFEEIIFRGIILRGLLFTYSPKKAIIFSAIIFGIIHVKPLQIWGAIILGLFFGWIFYKTKSIGNTIILHFTANIIILMQSYLYFEFLDIETVSIISFITIPISAILLFFIARKLYKEMDGNLIGNEKELQT